MLTIKFLKNYGDHKVGDICDYAGQGGHALIALNYAEAVEPLTKSDLIKINYHKMKNEQMEEYNMKLREQNEKTQYSNR
jgi:hypothetical protein